MELEGQLAPPMANGEVVFEAPWESRVFGMARALCEAGLYEWDDFRACLIREIDAWEQAHPACDDYHYFDRFACAFEALLAARGIVVPEELASRSEAFAARPHGHDH